MKITSIEISLLKEPKGRLKGFATVTFDEALVVRGFRIFQSARGTSIAMPSVRKPDGTWEDVVFPITSVLNDTINAALIRAFEDETARPR